MPLPLSLLSPQAVAVAEAYLRHSRTPGASITVVAGDRAYHHSYGLKSVNTGAPVTASTSFNIGSCTKAFVSAVIASLVADGLLTWDDPVSKHLPEFQLYDANVTAAVTLRDLCGNRLGLPREGLVEHGLHPRFAPEYAFDRLKFTQPLCPPRSRCTYVNVGHTAAAAIAGRVAGGSFLEVLKERVLIPLGMLSTSGGAATMSDLHDTAGWHVNLGRETREIDPVCTDLYLGGGGMWVSGADAAQWLRLQLNGGLVDGRQVIPRDAIKETHTPQVISNPGPDSIITLINPKAHMGAYALGWAVADLDGLPLVSHSGSDFGVSAMTLLFPRQGVGVALYLNCFSVDVLPAAYAIAGSVLGLPERDWYAHCGAPYQPPQRPKTPDIAMSSPEAYLGVFNHPADGPLVVSRQGDGLIGVLTDGYKTEFSLAPLGDNAFEVNVLTDDLKGVLAWVTPTLTFDMADGKAVAARLTMLGTRTFQRG